MTLEQPVPLVEKVVKKIGRTEQEGGQQRFGRRKAGSHTAPLTAGLAGQCFEFL